MIEVKLTPMRVPEITYYPIPPSDTQKAPEGAKCGTRRTHEAYHMKKERVCFCDWACGHFPKSIWVKEPQDYEKEWQSTLLAVFAAPVLGVLIPLVMLGIYLMLPY